MKKIPTSNLFKTVDVPSDTVFFMKSEKNDEILRLCSNGDILVKGKFIENDKEVVDAMREFLMSHLFLK